MTKLVLLLFLLPLALDYKTTGGLPHGPQYILVALTTLIGLASLVPRPKAGLKLDASPATLVILLTILGSIISCRINEIPLDRYIRVALPFLLFALGYFVALKIMKTRYRETMIRTAITGCFIFLRLRPNHYRVSVRNALPNCISRSPPRPVSGVLLLTH
jgi:hypothetical protein